MPVAFAVIITPSVTLYQREPMPSLLRRAIVLISPRHAAMPRARARVFRCFTLTLFCPPRYVFFYATRCYHRRDARRVFTTSCFRSRAKRCLTTPAGALRVDAFSYDRVSPSAIISMPPFSRCDMLFCHYDAYIRACLHACCYERVFLLNIL